MGKQLRDRPSTESLLLSNSSHSQLELWKLKKSRVIFPLPTPSSRNNVVSSLDLVEDNFSCALQGFSLILTDCEDHTPASQFSPEIHVSTQKDSVVISQDTAKNNSNLSISIEHEKCNAHINMPETPQPAEVLELDCNPTHSYDQSDIDQSPPGSPVSLSTLIDDYLSPVSSSSDNTVSTVETDLSTGDSFETFDLCNTQLAPAKIEQNSSQTLINTMSTSNGGTRRYQSDQSGYHHHNHHPRRKRFSLPPLVDLYQFQSSLHGQTAYIEIPDNLIVSYDTQRQYKRFSVPKDFQYFPPDQVLSQYSVGSLPPINQTGHSKHSNIFLSPNRPNVTPSKPLLRSSLPPSFSLLLPYSAQSTEKHSFVVTSHFCPYCDVYHSSDFCPATPSLPADPTPFYNRKLSLDLECSPFRYRNIAHNQKKRQSLYSLKRKPLPPLPRPPFETSKSLPIKPTPVRSTDTLSTLPQTASQTDSSQLETHSSTSSIVARTQSDTTPATMSLLKPHRHVSATTSTQNLSIQGPSAVASSSSLKTTKRPHFFRRLFGSSSTSSPTPTPSIPVKSKMSMATMRSTAESTLPVSSTRSNTSSGQSLPNAEDANKSLSVAKLKVSFHCVCFQLCFFSHHLLLPFSPEIFTPFFCVHVYSWPTEFNSFYGIIINLKVK